MLLSCLHIKTISQELKKVIRNVKIKLRCCEVNEKKKKSILKYCIQVETMIFGVSNYLILFEFIDLNTKYCSKVE